MSFELETPIPLVDLDRLDRNIDRMAKYAAGHGLGLRPHIKTHKAVRVATEQVGHGAIGLTCATPREAEVMSAVTGDLLVAHPPVGLKADRLARLPAGVNLMVALDSVESVETLARAARAGNRPVRVLVELDLGMHRVGVPAVEQAIAIAKLVKERPPLVYAGINFYPGHIRVPPGQQDQMLATLDGLLQSALQKLEAAGHKPGIVSGGSTPTAFQTHQIRGLTEFRPGTYAYLAGAYSPDAVLFPVYRYAVDLYQSLGGGFEAHAALDQAAHALEDEKRGVALVDMPDRRL